MTVVEVVAVIAANRTRKRQAATGTARAFAFCSLGLCQDDYKNNQPKENADPTTHESIAENLQCSLHGV
jgi:hypothetical protein